MLFVLSCHFIAPVKSPYSSKVCIFCPSFSASCYNRIFGNHIFAAASFRRNHIYRFFPFIELYCYGRLIVYDKPFPLAVVFFNLFRFDIETFPLYLLSGQIVFNFYNDSTTNAMTAIIGNAALIKKVYVPKYMFVISRVFSSFINLMASVTALMLVMIATRAELHWTIVLAVIPLILLVLLSLGIGLILSSVTVKFRDIEHLYSVFTTALMYLTPVIYPMSILPEWLYHIVMLNPLTNILLMFRDVMIYNTVFSISSLVLAIIETAVFMVI